MIITDDMVDKALEYLGLDPHPEATAKYGVATAENAVEKALYDGALLAPMQQPMARLNWSKAQQEYRNAKAIEANATLKYTNEKARVRYAEFVIECWRTQNANIRAAERIR